MKFSKFLKLATAVFAIFSTAYAAAEEPLYDAPPPEDAIFARFLGFDGHVDWRGYRLEAAQIEKGDYLVFHTGSSGIEPGEFVTVVPDPKQGKKEFLAPAGSARKVTLALFNLSSENVSLKTSDGKVAIIDDVPPAEAGYREVNPLAVSVQIFSAGDPVGEKQDLSLRRGENVAFLWHKKNKVKVILSEVQSGVIE